MKIITAYAVLLSVLSDSVNADPKIRRGRELQACATFQPNTMYHIKATHSDLGLAVAGSSGASGAAIVQFATGSNTGNDSWRFVTQSNGRNHIIAGNSGLALAVLGSSDDNGAKLVQTAPGGTSTEWCLISQGNDVYRIENVNAGKAIDIPAASKQSGTQAQLWSFWGGAQQKYTITVASTGGSPPSPPTQPSQPSPPSPTSAPVSTPGATHSDWDGPFNTPVIAVAAANLADGRIVMWAAFTRDQFGGDGGTQTWTAIYNPQNGNISEQLVRTNHDMFCPGTATLSDGRIMITGGSNSEATTFFNPNNNNWSVGPKMKIKRGYHSMTVLRDGSVFTIGGSWSGGNGNKDGEIWSASGGWRELSNVKDDPFVTDDDAGRYRSDNHAWLFLAPNGQLFHAGPSKQMNWVTTAGNGSVRGAGNRGNDSDAMNGNALMYDIGKIFTVGGAEHYDKGNGSNRAYVIDINGSQASVSRTGNMRYGRALHNSVLLPSGEVVVVGGRSSPGNLFSDNNSRMHAEIWSPATGQFKTLEEMDVPRNYHSVAILMKDGRVWAAGGGLCGGCSANHQDYEIMTPPYLFNNNGSLATRPVIQSAPGTVRAGNTFTVRMNTSGNHSFSMVRISSVTHSVNNDQRRIPLEVVSKNGSSFSLRLPSNQNVSVVGVYYLFAMNGSGVPSVADDVRISL